MKAGAIVNLSRAHLDIARRAVVAWFVLALLLLSPAAARAQHVDSLSQVKTLCVQPFGGGTAGAQLRDGLVRQLTKNSRFRLVPTPQGADAIVQGNGALWIRGYITTNSRAPSTNRQPVYGGYLSLEVVAANGEPLWSWLVTPDRLAWSSIVDELAGHAARKLVEASRTGTGPAPAATAAAALAPNTLIGAGATFPAPLYQKWFEDFEQLHPGVHIQYSPIGSQLGVERLVAGKLDFAGSDVAPEIATSTESAARLRRIASVLGAVVPIYNLQGLSQDLRFTPEALAGIYLGRIRRWSDPEIARSNRGVDLPDAEITVVHRSDGSGTTWIWSDYLSKLSPAWSSSAGRGTIIQWPVGVGAEHNEGVATTVRNTPNSIGYVELAYAIQQQLSYGAVRNRAGEYIHADLDNVTEAARSVPGAAEPSVDITDPPGKYAYPIASFTWLLVPDSVHNAAKQSALKELLQWILTNGQRDCSALGYAPLPREAAEKELRTLSGPS